MTHQDHEAWGSSSSDIECPQCGEQFFHELTSCPNCGRSVYPTDDDPPIDAQYGVDPDPDLIGEWFAIFAKPATIFMGLIVSFIASTIVFIAVRFILNDLIFSWPGRGILLLSAPIGAALGGFAAAAADKEEPRNMGIWVGVLSIIAAIVFASVDAARIGGWFGPESIPLWLFTVLSGAIGGEFWRRQQRDVVIQQLFGDLPSEEVLYKDLLMKIGYDEEIAERLIEYEKQFMPNATRRTLIESALERWQRDNK